MIDFVFGIVYIFFSLIKLLYDTFDDVRMSIKTIHQIGFMVVNEVEKSDMKKFEDKVTAQNTAHAMEKKKPKPNVANPLLISTLKK